MTRDELIRPVPALLKEHAELAPERVACADSARGVTYAGLERRTRALAGYLTRTGLARGDRVAICLGNRVEMVESCLAVLRAGLVGVPLDPRSSDAELARRRDGRRPDGRPRSGGRRARADRRHARHASGPPGRSRRGRLTAGGGDAGRHRTGAGPGGRGGLGAGAYGPVGDARTGRPGGPGRAARIAADAARGRRHRRTSTTRAERAGDGPPAGRTP
jgi:hypothetical protein